MASWNRFNASALTVALLCLSIALFPPLALAEGPDFTGREGAPLALNVTVDPGWPVDGWWWDFEGDGTFDGGPLGSPNTTHTYTTNGTFNAVLEARGTGGERTSWTFVVLVLPTNSPPSVTILKGPDGYIVTDRLSSIVFDAAAVDADGTVVLYEWDWEGDGVYDHSSTNGPRASHAYEQLGNFTAVLRVTDDGGQPSTDSVRVEVRNIPPRLESVFNITSYDPTVAMEVTASDLDGTIVRYEWSFGDGTDKWTTTGPSAVHDFNGTGRWLVHVAATDDDGGTSSTAMWVEVLPEAGNIPPTIMVGPEVSVRAGDTLTLTALATPGTAPIVSYHWDLDGDGTDDALGPVQNHTYAQSGIYHARVRVLDAAGLAATAVKRIKVLPPTEHPPVPVPSVEQWVAPGEGLDFGDLSYDPDGRIVLWQWDFDGDGVFEYASNRSGNTTHHYAEEGVYAAVLRVTDDRGNVNSTAVTVRVDDEAPGDGDQVDDSKGAVVCCASTLVVLVLVSYYTLRKSLRTPRKDTGGGGGGDGSGGGPPPAGD